MIVSNSGALSMNHFKDLEYITTYICVCVHVCVIVCVSIYNACVHVCYQIQFFTCRNYGFKDLLYVNFKNNFIYEGPSTI